MSSLVAVVGLTLVLAAPAVATMPADEWETFSIGRNVEPIIIPVTIGDHSYPFLVDTGSTSSVFDVSLSPLLGDQIEHRIISTPAGPKEFPFAKTKTASVGKLTWSGDSAVMIHDLSPLREALGLDIRGCLGMDFLSQFVVCLDFDQGQMTLLRSSDPSAGQRLPLKLEGGRPWVEASVPGVDRAEWFLLDTGHIGLDSGRLRPELIRQLSEAGKMRPVAASQVETGGGRMEIRQGFLDCLRIGGFEHKGLLVSNTQDCNALGLGFCSRYRITLDFPARVVYLQASKRHAIEDQPGGSGLGILRRGGKTVIEGVQDNSPAAKAGICRGDELLSVDGCKAEENCIVALGRLLAGTGRTVRLVMRRGDDVREVPLSLDTSWRIAGKGH